MTATLDFTPDFSQFNSARSVRPLPVYDSAVDPGYDLSAERDVLSQPARVAAEAPRSSAALSRPVIAILVAAAIIFGLVVFGGGAAANAPFEPASTESSIDAATEVYIVQPGDTLWAIAERIAPAGADLRPTVDYLSDVAGGAQLEIGQRIVIDHAAISG